METNVNSTKVPFPHKKSEDSGNWCDFYLADLVYKEIAVIKLTSSQVETLLRRGRTFDSRKYYSQAHPYLKISALESIPDFCISKSDLSAQVVKSLMGYDAEERAVVLKHAVERIFEDIGARLYHERISKVLTVRLVS